MKTKIVLGSLGGAVLIHAVLAACDGKTTASTNDKEASADNPPATSAVQVDVEDCTLTFQQPAPVGPPTTVHYAEHAYAGLSKEYLAGHVTNWATVTAPDFVPPTGYTLILQGVLYVKDGFVGANCGSAATTTFIYAP